MVKQEEDKTPPTELQEKFLLKEVQPMTLFKCGFVTRTENRLLSASKVFDDADDVIICKLKVHAFSLSLFSLSLHICLYFVVAINLDIQN